MNIRDFDSLTENYIRVHGEKLFSYFGDYLHSSKGVMWQSCENYLSSLRTLVDNKCNNAVNELGTIRYDLK